MKKLSMINGIVLAKEKQKGRRQKKYKIIYTSSQGNDHYVYVHAPDEHLAQQEFFNYFSSDGDKITNVEEEF
jgi:hypothetical protein